MGAGTGEVTTALVKSTGRRGKARSLLQQDTADRYAIIFRTESILRGVVEDDILFPLILHMHKTLVEDVLSGEPDIQVVKWDMLMLRRHYNARNGHFFDKVRWLKAELRRAARALDYLEDHDEEEDSDNPGQMVPNIRALSERRQWQRQQVQLLKDYDAWQKEKAEDWPAATFALASAIDRLTGQATNHAQRNPRIAAGTVALGGDALRSMSASKSTSKMVGSAYEFLATSGF